MSGGRERPLAPAEKVQAVRKRIRGLSFAVGSFLVAAAGLLTVVSTFGLYFGLGLERHSLAFLLVAAAGAGWLQYRWCHLQFPGRPRLAFAVALTLSAGIVATALPLAGHFMDISGDGQWVHQEAIIRLDNGWNPIYERLSNDGYEDWGATIYAASFPHGLWIDSAVVAGVAHNIESGKVWNLILAFGALFMSLAAFLSLDLGLVASSGLALATAANPVVLYQLFSYYNDGAVFSLLASLLAVCVVLFNERWRGAWVVLALVVILLVNVKFLGLAYGIGALLCVAFMFWILRADRRLLPRFALVSVIGLVTGAALIGFSPYVLNTIRYGHPFYPIAGDKAIARVWNGPECLHRFGRVGDAVYGIFGEPGMLYPNTSAVHLKAPFSVRSKDLMWYRYWPDPHIGGYGVLFGETLVLSAIVFVLLGAWLARRDLWRPFLAAGAGIASLLFAVLMKECAWLARYNAQLCLAPVIVCALVFWSCGKTGIPVAIRVGAWALIVLLLVNASLIAGEYVSGQTELTTTLRFELAKIRALSSHGPVPVFFGHLRSNRERWKAAGIVFREVRSEAELPCAAPQEIWFCHLKYCAPPPQLPTPAKTP